MNERKAFYKELWRLMLPLAFQNMMMTLVSATDALVLARVDQNSVAAVSLATEVCFVMNLFTGTIIGGIAIMAAQYWGKGDKKTVENLMGMALRYNIVISLVFFLGAFFVPETLMGLYASDSALIEIGAGYLRIASWSYLLSAISQAYVCVMKLSGGASVCAAITTMTAVVDVIVDIFLVYGLWGVPRLGANGTAISTVAVCLVEFAGVVLYSHRKGRLHPKMQNLLFYAKTLERDFWRISLPVLAGNLVWGLGFSMSAAIMGHMGADAAAANSIAALLRNLFTCFIRGMGTGAGILIGNSLGSGNMAAAKVQGSRLFKASLVCGIFSGALFAGFSPLLSQFFILNATARLYLNQMVPIVSVYLVAQSVNVTVICGVFAAGGDTKFDAMITAITMWLVSLPLGFLGAFVFELPVAAVYLLVCLDEIVKAPWVLPRFRKYLWLQNLTRDL